MLKCSPPGRNLYLSLSLSGSRGDSIPRKALEAYCDIAEALCKAYGKKPFPGTELANLFLQEMNVIREETRAAHIKAMINLGYLVQEAGDTYRLGRWALDSATKHGAIVPAFKNAKELRRRH